MSDTSLNSKSLEALYDQPLTPPPHCKHAMCVPGKGRNTRTHMSFKLPVDSKAGTTGLLPLTVPPPKILTRQHRSPQPQPQSLLKCQSHSVEGAVELSPILHRNVVTAVETKFLQSTALCVTQSPQGGSDSNTVSSQSPQGGSDNSTMVSQSPQWGSDTSSSQSPQGGSDNSTMVSQLAQGGSDNTTMVSQSSQGGSDTSSSQSPQGDSDNSTMVSQLAQGGSDNSTVSSQSPGHENTARSPGGFVTIDKPVTVFLSPNNKSKYTKVVITASVSEGNGVQGLPSLHMIPGGTVT